MNLLADLHRLPIERSYEYAIADMDEYGDIHNYDFADTYREALGCADFIDGNWMIELWVNFGNSEIGLSNRNYYEIVDGMLQGEYPKHVEKHFEKTRK
tara:strand:+ start:1241 stop:1534 length:294 start_codon:yes stop_codon:yes gene_type:complete